MFSSTIKALILAALLAAGINVAQATIINFDSFKSSNTNFLSAGATFSTAGYNFSILDGLVWFLNNSNASNASNNGTTSLDLGGTVSITNPTNKLFSVTSIDLATVLALETSTVKFTGTDASGTKTVQSYSMNGSTSADPYRLTTKSLTGFSNLVSFDMELVYNLGPSTTTYFSLVDNIVINEVTTSVPEPSTWALLALGLAMAVGFGRHKSLA
jgi:hypothetical protein